MQCAFEEKHDDLPSFKLLRNSVDPRTRSSPVAPAAGRSPITHSHSTANRINHTLYDIHSYNNTQALIALENYKESGVVTSPTLAVNVISTTKSTKYVQDFGDHVCFLSVNVQAAENHSQYHWINSIISINIHLSIHLYNYGNLSAAHTVSKKCQAYYKLCR